MIFVGMAYGLAFETILAAIILTLVGGHATAALACGAVAVVLVVGLAASEAIRG